MEQKFPTFYERIRLTLNNGGTGDSIRTGVWAECERTTTFFFNITPIKAKDKIPYQFMFEAN
jgi:hypothetical protein